MSINDNHGFEEKKLRQMHFYCTMLIIFFNLIELDY